jgi:hypothetical protein
MGCVEVVVPAFGEICVCSPDWELCYVVVQRLVAIVGCIRVVVLLFIGKHAYCGGRWLGVVVFYGYGSGA